MTNPRHQRTNRERIERVRFLIERDLENPPSLEMRAEEVACSPFYLSRVFAQETGARIPKFLRTKTEAFLMSFRGSLRPVEIWSGNFFTASEPGGLLKKAIRGCSGAPSR